LSFVPDSSFPAAALGSPVGGGGKSSPALRQEYQRCLRHVQPGDRKVRLLSNAQRAPTQLQEVRGRRESEVDVETRLEAVHRVAIELPLARFGSHDVDVATLLAHPAGDHAASRSPVRRAVHPVRQAGRTLLVSEHGRAFEAPPIVCATHARRIMTRSIDPLPKR
jgi:hypothetical protein